MKLVFLFALFIVAAFGGYQIGYNNGLEDSQDFVKLELIRERQTTLQHAELIASLGNLGPTLEECVAELNGFDGDIGGLCTNYFEQDAEARQNANEWGERGQYE